MKIKILLKKLKDLLIKVEIMTRIKDKVKSSIVSFHSMEAIVIFQIKKVLFNMLQLLLKQILKIKRGVPSEEVIITKK